jgi:hypothetical protein
MTVATLAWCVAANAAPLRHTVRAAISKSFPHRHLLVADDASHSIKRFLLTGGLPAPQPDSQITGLFAPVSVGVDPTGRVVVGEDDGILSDPRNRVEVYSRNASGMATPQRVLKFEGADFLTLDQAGYLYIGADLGSALINVFAPGFNGNDSPIQAFGLADSGIALDRDGNLYASNEGGPCCHAQVDIYANPITAPQQVRTLCMPWHHGGFGVAVSPAERVFAIGLTAINVYAKDANGCTPPAKHRAIIPSPPFGSPRGALDYEGYLYVADEAEGAIYVYDATRRGAQTPIAVVSGVDPWGIAIGY